MIDVFSRARFSFARGIERARVGLALYSYVKGIAPPALSCDDLLRTSLVTASSAFDLLNHDAFRAVIIEKFKANALSLVIPISLEVVHLTPQEATTRIDAHLKDAMSHKSYLQPDKIAQLYTPIYPSFWVAVSNRIGVEESYIKQRIRSLGKWRNRIVHEADIDPNLGGIAEWPVIVEDVADAVQTYHVTGEAILYCLAASLTSAG